MNKWDIEDFQGSENTLYDTIMVGTCHYKFVQTHRTLYELGQTPGMKLIVNFE